VINIMNKPWQFFPKFWDHTVTLFGPGHP